MTLFESPTDRAMGQDHVISSPLDALAPWLEVIDMIVQRYFAAQQARGDDRFNIGSIMIPMDVLEAAAHVPTGRPKWLDACASESNPTDVLPPLPELLAGVVQRFGLREFDVLAILLGMMPVLEPRYGALLAYIQGDEQALWPHIDLILSLFSAPGDRVQHRMRLTAADQPLRYGGLIHLSERSGRTSSREDVLYICTASSVVGYLSTGVVPLSQKMVDVGQWLTPMAPNVLELSAEWRRFGTDLQQFCFGQASATTPVVLLEGGEGRDKMLAHVAAEAGRQAFLVDLQSLPEEANEAWPALLEALHVTRLSASLLVFKNFTSFEQAHPKLLRALDVRLRTHGEPVVVLLAADANGPGLRDLPRLKMPLPRQSAHDDVAAVGAALFQRDGALPAMNGPDDLPQLLKRTRVDLNTLNYAVHEAQWYAQQRAPSAALDGQDIYQALRSRALQQFGPLAQRLEPRRGMSDLVISEDLREQMDEILAAISYRDDVLKRGFAKKLAYGVGVSALFYGDSGTGKSMAAEALAFELGLDLIRVDLSTVVNKYVGETEKNLSTIFDLALADTGVLLFDEADALFGKRSEVTNAQDRHANIEVSYLLQRLEHYPGLVVLSTNNRGHLDSAFTRRLTFMARFELPDVTLRTQMWERIWPAGVERSADINWAELAKRAELTGAGIRNVALLASWLAARAKRPVGMVDIERAMRRELGKTGRLMAPA